MLRTELNQTSKFLLASHWYGVFDQPEVKEVRQLVLSGQKDNPTLLGRFHAGLRRIVDVIRDSDEQQLEVSWGDQEPLLITEQIGEGRKALHLICVGCGMTHPTQRPPEAALEMFKNVKSCMMRVDVEDPRQLNSLI